MNWLKKSNLYRVLQRSYLSVLWVLLPLGVMVVGLSELYHQINLPGSKVHLQAWVTTVVAKAFLVTHQPCISQQWLQRSGILMQQYYPGLEKSFVVNKPVCSKTINQDDLSDLLDDSLWRITESDNYAYAYRLYRLGIKALANHDQETALWLWNLALVAAPQWSYFHIELASLAAQSGVSDQNLAAIFANCEFFETARTHCRQLYYQWQTKMLLPVPGSYRNEIEIIPHE